MGERTICIGLAGLLGAALVLGAPAAWAQVRPGSESGLGLVGADVPPLLAQVKADPYKPPLAPACDTIPAEILQLSNLIGPDLDSGVAPEEESLTQRGVNMARGFVPYGGVVRFVTGANKKDKDLRDAIMAGYARRGFLRGMEVNLKCGAAAQAQVADPPAATPAPAKKSRAKATKGG